MARRATPSIALVVAVLAAASACSSSGRTSVVTLVTHSSPGGGSDVFLRSMAPHLSRILHETLIVENVEGGSGAKAMAQLARAKPDGSEFYATTPTFIYTSLMSTPAATYHDLEPLVNIFYDPEVLFTAADSPYKTLKNVIDHARGGQGRWGAANPASLERQTMERLKEKAGVNPAIATFEGGGDMLINVLNHTLDMGVGELEEMRGQLDAGKIRLLGVVGDDRLPQFPDLATVKEQGIDLSVRKFRGLAGPKGLPNDVVARWEEAVRALLEDPEYKKLYLADGLQPGFMPHDEYVAFMNQFGNETAAFLKESGVIQK
ncbi:MAG TPA: tripartite tricarboxylate transporter substrate binding protein [Vicinamibacterales bacterium]|jgi:putative tricarboxylic transport membrane protein|nr:tripartite tricarboxylate transporter substrate binding protein [Vicinamibacterales bacterium]